MPTSASSISTSASSRRRASDSTSTPRSCAAAASSAWTAALGQYSGALHLEIEGLASLSALGLLNTRIPGGGFSLLVIITADGFRPIPIGFGFMLAGIGGLLGIHRTVNEDAVQSGVRANTLGAVLAPKDLVRNAPQYLSTLGSFFPVAPITTCSVRWCS